MISSYVCLGLRSLHLRVAFHFPSHGLRLPYILSASQARDSPIYKSLSQHTQRYICATHFLFYRNSLQPISSSGRDCRVAPRFTGKVFHGCTRHFSDILPSVHKAIVTTSSLLRNLLTSDEYSELKPTPIIPAFVPRFFSQFTQDHLLHITLRHMHYIFLIHVTVTYLILLCSITEPYNSWDNKSALNATVDSFYTQCIYNARDNRCRVENTVKLSTVANLL